MPSPVAQSSASALPIQHITAGCTETGLTLEARTEQQKLDFLSERRGLLVDQRLAGNTALLEAEEALDLGKSGLASARLLAARYFACFSTIINILLAGTLIPCILHELYKNG
jgi:hypothetical protein